MQTSDKQSKQSKKIKKINEELKRSRRVAVATASPAATATVLRVEKAVRRRVQLKETHLSRWAQALSHPFQSMGAICPVNFNNVPSALSTTARLTHTNLNVSVPGGQTQQWVFFPGHSGIMPDVQLTTPVVPGNQVNVGSQMDPSAFHCRLDVGPVAGGGVPGGRACAGPIAYDGGGLSYAPVAGATANLAITACSNTVAGFGVRYDTDLPYRSSGSTGFGAGHSRFQLVSMGIRVFNTTPMIQRGGNVVSVQFTNQNGLVTSSGANATLQSELEFNPSFKTHGDAAEGVEISWIPRMQDLAYWHNLYPQGGETEAFTQRNLAGVGLALFLNNPTGAAQSFTIQCVFNYMLSGNLVQAISSPATVEPQIKPSVEQTVVHLQNTASTATAAPLVAEAASKGDDGTTMFEKLSNRAYKLLSENAHAITSGAIEAGLNHLSYGHARYGGSLVPRMT